MKTSCSTPTFPLELVWLCARKPNMMVGGVLKTYWRRWMRGRYTIFQAQFPGKQALFGFDNATGHCAFVPNALHANRINLGSGSKFPLMRSTIRGEENFKPWFWKDHPKLGWRKQSKGIKVVLQERGPSREGLRLSCMRGWKNLLAGNKGHSNFVSHRGMLVIFYSKYHCAQSYIENYWGAAKHLARKNCDYSWVGWRNTVPRAVASVPLNQIWRSARKVQRYMDVYHKGLSG